MTERPNAEVTVGGRPIEITHGDKALFEQPKVTKLDLARYYAAGGRGDAPARTRSAVGAGGVSAGNRAPGFFMKSVPRALPGLDRRHRGAQARRLADPGARQRSGDDGLPGRTKRRHAPRLALADRRSAPARPAHHRSRPVTGDPLRRGPGGGPRDRRAPARRGAGHLRDGHRVARCARGRTAATRGRRSARYTGSREPWPRRWWPTIPSG